MRRGSGSTGRTGVFFAREEATNLLVDIFGALVRL
jgi:hypothetical protein